MDGVGDYWTAKWVTTGRSVTVAHDLLNDRIIIRSGGGSEVTLAPHEYATIGLPLHRLAVDAIHNYLFPFEASKSILYQ